MGNTVCCKNNPADKQAMDVVDPSKIAIDSKTQGLSS